MPGGGGEGPTPWPAPSPPPVGPAAHTQRKRKGGSADTDSPDTHALWLALCPEGDAPSLQKVVVKCVNLCSEEYKAVCEWRDPIQGFAAVQLAVALCARRGGAGDGRCCSWRRVGRSQAHYPRPQYCLHSTALYIQCVHTPRLPQCTRACARPRVQHRHARQARPRWIDY